MSEQDVTGHNQFGVVRGRERFDKKLRGTAVSARSIQKLQHQRHRRRDQHGHWVLAGGQRGRPHATQRFRAGHKQVAHKLGRAPDGHHHAGPVGQHVAIPVHVRGGRRHGVYVAAAVAESVLQLAAQQLRVVRFQSHRPREISQQKGTGIKLLFELTGVCV